MDESSFNMAVRKFLKEVGVTSQREIERVVREGKVEGDKLKLRVTLTAENAPLNHIVEAVSRLRELSPLWEMHLEGIDIKSIEWADH